MKDSEPRSQKSRSDLLFTVNPTDEASEAEVLNETEVRRNDARSPRVSQVSVRAWLRKLACFNRRSRVFSVFTM